MDAPIPYAREDFPDQNWPPGNWTSDQLARTVTVKGSCPGCQHDTREVVPYAIMTPSVTFSRRPKKDKSLPQIPEPIYMQCNCGQPHPNRPGDGMGCGAAWNVFKTKGG